MTETTEIGLQRQTLSVQIYASLDAKILSGELTPGTKLSEESLAERYGVSRAPVREALTILQRLGLAEKSGLRDRIIAIPTAEIIIQKYDLWWVVDVGRTYLAALEASPAHCDRLAELIAAMRVALQDNNEPGYRKLAAQFHEAIRQGCNNPFVDELAANADIHLRWFEALYDRDPEISAAAVDEHTEILAAFRAKNFAALADTVRIHMLRQRDRMLRLFHAIPNTADATSP